LNLDGLEQRGRGHEPSCDGNDEIQDAEHVPGPDKACCFAWGSCIGEPHHWSEKADGDVAHAGRPGKQAGQPSGRIENEEDHA